MISVDYSELDCDVAKSESIEDALRDLRRTLELDTSSCQFYAYHVHLKGRESNDFLAGHNGPDGLYNDFISAGGTATDLIAQEIETIDEAFPVKFVDVLESLSRKGDTRENFIASFIRHGFNKVWICPILEADLGGYGVLNHFFADPEAPAPLPAKELLKLAGHFHQSVKKHGLLARVVGITRKQVTVLERLSEGSTGAEIAELEGITERAVELRIKGAREKLQASNSTEAVYKAAAYGIIPRNRTTTT